MKKTMLVAAMAALAMSAVLWGQSITVKSPKVGDEWCIGNPYTITWTKSGTMPDTVAIRLRRAGAPESELAVANLTASTPNDGSFAWTVPASVPAGDYFMRVRTKNPSVIGDSDIFHIQDRQLIKINITSPSGGERFPVPGNFSVRWNVEGGNPVENINLIVKKGSHVISKKLIDNTGAFDTSLPEAIRDGNDYTIRLEDAADASHFAESNNFEIYHSRAPSINISKPNQFTFIAGETMNIKWECWGFDKEVNVELLMEGNPAGFLCRNLRDGFYNWQAIRPADAPPGNYFQIRISATGNNNVSGISNAFLILLPSDLLVYSKGIFEKKNFVRGESTNIRFIVKDPSEKRAPIRVKIAIDFIRGHIKNPREISMNKVYALANTKYTGNNIAHVNPGTTTAFELPVTISDQPGEYTVRITVLPTDPIDPIPGNNTIYGYYKVVLVPLKIIK